MAGFPAREVCDKFALVVVRRGVGHFSTVNAKVVTEGGYPSPILFPPAPSLPTATPDSPCQPLPHPTILQRLPEYPYTFSHSGVLFLPVF